MSNKVQAQIARFYTEGEFKLLATHVMLGCIQKKKEKKY